MYIKKHKIFFAIASYSMVNIIVVAALMSLICLPVQFSAAQPTLEECGSAGSEVTCSFFFNQVDAAFKDDNTLYTLRKFFFQTEVTPVSFDVVMTLTVKNLPDIPCSDLDIPVSYFEQEDYLNTEICQNISTDSQIQLSCSSYQNTWRHQWSRTILSFIIAREHLEILQDTSIAAFSIAEFNSFDTSVFSKENSEGHVNSSQISSDSKSISLFLQIDFLPCMPDEEVLLTAWEEILPWVSE